MRSEDKDGRDVGELCGIELVGVLATRNKEALLAMPADCVCFTIGRTWMQQGKDALIDELCQMRKLR